MKFKRDDQMLLCGLVMTVEEVRRDAYLIRSPTGREYEVDADFADEFGHPAPAAQSTEETFNG